MQYVCYIISEFVNCSIFQSNDILLPGPDFKNTVCYFFNQFMKYRPGLSNRCYSLYWFSKLIFIMLIIDHIEFECYVFFLIMSIFMGFLEEACCGHSPTYQLRFYDYILLPCHDYMLVLGIHFCDIGTLRDGWESPEGLRPPACNENIPGDLFSGSVTFVLSTTFMIPWDNKMP